MERTEMPFYDYGCGTCGPFREWRSMSEWRADVPCATCGAPAPRLAAAPMLTVLSPNNRIAHARNERSAHEPRVVRREDLPQGHLHHDHRRGVSPLVKQQFGDVRRSPPDRPWMVGH
jgi:putative FmdB family regulatory protein